MAHPSIRRQIRHRLQTELLPTRDFLAQWKMMQRPGRSKGWPAKDRDQEARTKGQKAKRCRWLVWVSRRLYVYLNQWLFKITLKWSVLVESVAQWLNEGQQRSWSVPAGLNVCWLQRCQTHSHIYISFCESPKCADVSKVYRVAWETDESVFSLTCA